MFLCSTALLGALIPVFRSMISDGEQTTDREASLLALLQQEADSSVSDSLKKLMAEDSLKIKDWAQQSEYFKSRLSGLQTDTELDSLLSATGDEPLKAVSINTADAHAFASLPGIGPKLAERIIQYRTLNGPFQKPEDLKKVKGIGNKLFQKIKPHITL